MGTARFRSTHTHAQNTIFSGVQRGTASTLFYWVQFICGIEDKINNNKSSKNSQLFMT